MRQGNYSVLKWCSGKPMSMKPVVIVTGASRGLGAAVARWLAKSAAVTLMARSEEKLQQIAYYRRLKERGELEPPEVPARAIAWLALYAPREFSGKFLDYDDPRISRPALEVFGETLV